MEFTTGQIATLVGGEVKGDATVKIRTVAKIEEAKEGSISFLSNPKYENFIYDTGASAVIVNKSFIPKNQLNTTLIVVDDAYSSFTSLLEAYQKLLRSSKKGVEQPAFIGDQVTIGENIYRGAFSYIGNNCKIGNNVKIYPNSYIGDNVTIGDDCLIYAGVKIYNNTLIGTGCTIHSGVVIGSDGFGFAPQKDGSYKDIPQIGNVIIEDNVSIGANTVIDCATMGSTVIRKGSKLDNLIQVAHNAEIGKHTVIAAQTGVSGSTKIGDHCMVGGQVGFVGHIKIADRTSIGAQAGVSKSVTKVGTSITGSPATDYKKHLKALSVFKNLPELQKKVEELEEKIINLKTI